MKVKTIILATAAAAVALLGINYARLQAPLSAVIAEDTRNRGLEVWAYYAWGVSPSEIVYDVRALDGNNSAADVTRTLLQFASRLKDRDFDKVRLAWRGETRFILEGRYFHTLGQEYGIQNPVYTLRTLPENVKRPDGAPAFGTWTGGMLGVLGAQMDDLGKFHAAWFVDDAIRRAR